jgi:DNA-binding winged helix-turn-helix (wHTH) protein/TolB-like protein
MSKTSVKPPEGRFTVFLGQITAKLMPMNSDTSQLVFQCGDICIEPETGMVRNPLESVRLGPVNMQVLITLLESSGQVVRRSVIFDRVWTNQIISDDTLTRCISDLRTQLRVFSEFSDAIETLPKRGYRWTPEVKLQYQSLPIQKIIEPDISSEPKTWRHYLILGSIGIVFLLLLSTSVLWITEQIIRPDLIRVALLPIQVHQDTPSQDTGKQKAQSLDELLRVQLLATDKLRFLSNSAIQQRPENPFPYFTRQFGTQWIIEGNIRPVDEKLRVSLDLVDARTAMVSFNLTQEIENTPEALKAFSQEFVGELVQILGL